MRHVQVGTDPSTDYLDNELPCASWAGNTASDNAYGDIIATRPYYLSAPVKLESYRSYYQDLALEVMALDYYGQHCTAAGMEPIIVNVVSPERLVSTQYLHVV